MQTSLPLDSAPARVAHDRPGFATLLGSALLDPARLARELRRADAPLLAPVVLLAAATALVLAWYYARLDYAWFGEHLRATNPIVAKYAGRGTLHLTQAALLGPALLSATLGIVAAWLLTGVYLWLAGKLLRDDTPCRQWLALAAWSNAPAILVLPLAAATIALHGDGRIAPDQLDPTTLAAILGVPAGAALHGAAAKIGLAAVWSWAVLTVGVHRWTHLGYPRAAAIVVAPHAALVALGFLPALVA